MSDRNGSEGAELCRAYMKNMCERGTRCKFYHPPGVHGAGTVMPYDRDRSPIRSSYASHSNDDGHRPGLGMGGTTNFHGVSTPAIGGGSRNPYGSGSNAVELGPRRTLGATQQYEDIVHSQVLAIATVVPVRPERRRHWPPHNHSLPLLPTRMWRRTRNRHH
ncbi:unnamed protein product [Sphagnum balticum]